MFKNNLLSTLLLTTTLFGCGKGNEIEPSKTEIISGKRWLTTYVTYRVGNGPEESHFDTPDPCRTEQITSFKKDGKYEVKEGVSPCAPDLPSWIQKGSWFISGDTLYTHLAVEPKNLLTLKVKILELTEDKLVTEDILDPNAGDPSTAQILKVTYKSIR